MRKALKYIGLSIAGLLQGTLGSYFAVLGLAFAFPETEPGMRDYEEDMFFVPFGYIMMLIWIAVMIFLIIILRKDKANTISFFLAWCVGLIVFLVLTFLIY